MASRRGGGAREREFEVELEGADARGQLTLLVTEGEADLDYLQQVDVAAQRLVVKVGRRLEGANGTGDDPRELCVLPTDAWRGSGEAVRGRARVAMRGWRGVRCERVACARAGRAAADHGNVRVVHDGLTDHGELGVDVVGPHITVMGSCHWPDVQPRPTAPCAEPCGLRHCAAVLRGAACRVAEGRKFSGLLLTETLT